MGFFKKFAFGTICSSGLLMTYWYYYPRHFYENYKLINKVLYSKYKDSQSRPKPPIHD